MGLTRDLESFDLSLTKWVTGKYSGTVITAINTKTNKSVAVKLFDLSSKSQTCFMIIEIDVMSRIRHPHIMSISNIISKHNGLLNNYIGVLMPLADNTLCEVNMKHYTVDQHLTVFHKLANGLAYLHSQHILHLDIKHDNVVMSNNEPYWIDFGSSSLVGDISIGLEHQSELVASLYRAPEIYNGDRHYTGATDVWAFGMLLFFSVTDNISDIDTTERYISYQSLCSKFGTTDYVSTELSNISKFSASEKSLLTNVISSMLQLLPTERFTMKQVCDDAIFSGKPNINGITAAITYSKNFHAQHHIIVTKFIKWVCSNYEDQTCVIFLTIDMYYRVAGLYSNNTDLTFEVLAILFIIARKIFEEGIPEQSILDKFCFISSDKTQLEVQLIHQLNGIIYHSPYYDAAYDADELELVLTTIILHPDPLLYTTTDINKWFADHRAKLDF